MMEYATFAVAALALMIALGKDLFGGGRHLATAFAGLDKSLTQEIAELRNEVRDKQDAAEAISHDAITGIRQQMHDLEKSALEHRAKAAETYMTWDAYREISRDLKIDMKEGFEKLDKRLARIEQGRPHG